MKIKIAKNTAETQFLNDDGTPMADLLVKSIKLDLDGGTSTTAVTLEVYTDELEIEVDAQNITVIQAEPKTGIISPYRKDQKEHNGEAAATATEQSEA